MAEYFTDQEYLDWIGEPVPSDVDRKEYLAVTLFCSVLTCPFPTPEQLEEFSEDCQVAVQRAVMEQIKWFNENASALNGFNPTGGSFSIGRYSETENEGKPINITDYMKRVSPIAWQLLDCCGLTYKGVRTRSKHCRKYSNQYMGGIC